MGADARSGCGPSRPDAFGQPRPPAALRSGAPYRHATRLWHLDPHRPQRRWCIGPPRRPPLEAAAVARLARLTEAALESAWFIVCYVILYAYFNWRSHWVGMWWILLAFTVLTVLWRWLVIASEFSPPIVAGSDWVGMGRGGRRSVWLPLYELSQVHARRARDSDNEPIPGTVVLILTCDERGELDLELRLLQANPALWDLVYQGLTSSIAAGAKLTDQARRALNDATQPDETSSRRTRPEKSLYRAGAWAVGGRIDRAVAAYDKLVTRYDADPDPDTRRVVALALFAKALALARADRFTEAISAYAVALTRYRDTSVSELRDRVSEALHNQAACLDGLGRVVEAIDGYDEAIAFYRTAPSEGSRVNYLGALVNRSGDVMDLGRPTEALNGYEQVIADYRDDPVPELRHNLQVAQLNTAHVLNELGRTDEALTTYQEMITEHRDDTNTESRGLVSSALLHLGMTLAERGRLGEALTAYQQVIDDHSRAAVEAIGDDENTPITYEQRLAALLHKARALAKLGRPEEALDSYRKVVETYRFNPQPSWHELAVSALRETSALLTDLGRTKEAMAAHDAVDKLPSGPLRKPSIWAVSNRRT